MQIHHKYSLFALGLFILTVSSCEFTTRQSGAKSAKAAAKSRIQNPPKFQNRSEKGLFVKADYLCWQASEDGLGYAAHLKINEKKTSYKDLNFDYRSGLRVGIGYTNDGWDVLANWTGYNGKGHGKAKADALGNDTLIPAWGNLSITASQGTALDRASAKWNLDYNVLDFELGHNFFFGGRSSLRPFVGAEWAVIQQDYHVKYHVPTLTTNSGGGSMTDPFTTHFASHNNYSGAGLRCGAHAKWYFTHHFGISAKAAGALLWGRFNVSEKFKIPDITVTTPSSTTVSPSITVKNTAHYSRVRPNLQGAAGLFWQQSFHEEKRSILVALEYEFIAWFFQNQLTPSSNTLTASGGAISQTSNTGLVPPQNPSGLLGLQGLTASICFEF